MNKENCRMTMDEQAEIVIANLYRVIGEPGISGLSVFAVACKLGASQKLAARVVELWTGPDPLP